VSNLSLALMNSFNKTEAVLFLMQTVVHKPKGFPLMIFNSQLNVFILYLHEILCRANEIIILCEQVVLSRMHHLYMCAMSFERDV